jgi:hypothetical protein
MSGVFDLRKLSVLDVLVVVKLRDREISAEGISESLLTIMDLSRTGPLELSVKQVKVQILAIDLCTSRSPSEKRNLEEKLSSVPGLAFKVLGPFGCKRDEAIASYNEVFRFPFSILVELPTSDLNAAKNVLKLVRPIVDGADFVVGQRKVTVSALSLLKLKVLHGYFWLRFGYPVGDWTSEYLSWRHWAITSVEYQVLMANGTAYLAELKNRCLDKGFRARSVELIGEPPSSEFEFLGGFRVFEEARGIQSTL